MIQQVFEALPVETPTLASSVQPLQQDRHCPTVELFQPNSIPFHSVVVVIPSQLPVQLREEHLQSNIATLLAPLGEVGDRVAQFLSGSSARDVRFARAVFVPAKLEPEKVEPRRAWLVASTEVHHSSLVSSQLQAVLFESELKHLKEGRGVLFILECADEIIRVSNETRLASYVSLHHLLKPQVKCVVQVHVGEQR